MIVENTYGEIQMAIYLDELYMGHDQDTIGFPHLLLCNGLVLAVDNQLYGVHLQGRADTQKSINIFLQYLNNEGVLPAQYRLLYGSCNLKVRYGNGKADWVAEMNEIAGILGYHGQALGFDTSIIHPKDGTYVEYRLQQNNSCRIYYKRHEKVDYGDFARNPDNTIARNENLAKIGANFTKIMDYKNLTMVSSAKVKETKSNKGELHEVDLARRLMRAQV